MIPSAAPFTKSTQTSGAGCGGTGATAGLLPPPQGLKCPRCSSPHTKFCYYNNYSLSQPRYFCKTCRRYWTKGGALRNVPVGGGIRKTPKTNSKSSSFSQLLPPATVAGAGNRELTEILVRGNYEGSNSIASSIESLSSINQDLHWKLQQQRLQGTANWFLDGSVFAGNHQNGEGDGNCRNIGESGGGDWTGVTGIRDNWTDFMPHFTLLP